MSKWLLMDMATINSIQVQLVNSDVALGCDTVAQRERGNFFAQINLQYRLSG